MIVWGRIATAIDKGGSAALVSIVAVQGSVPRGPGARMVVQTDGGFFGTIGGGALEFAMLAEARKRLSEGAGTVGGWPIRQALGPDLGQCCGGSATVAVETFNRGDMPWIRPLALAEQARGFIETCGKPDARGRLIRRLGGSGERAAEADEVAEVFGERMTPLMLFGAGHVGRALVLALAPLPFRVDWIDPRSEAFPSAVPGNVRVRVAADPASVVAGALPGTFVAVMTHSHPLDLAIVALTLGDPRFDYVGLIGSASKKSRFASQLKKAGHDGDVISRLVCPIGGQRLRDKSPPVIAATIAVELLEARERSIL